jgi:hypothetical protein
LTYLQDIRERLGRVETSLSDRAATLEAVSFQAVVNRPGNYGVERSSPYQVLCKRINTVEISVASLQRDPYADTVIDPATTNGAKVVMNRLKTCEHNIAELKEELGRITRGSIG